MAKARDIPGLTADLPFAQAAAKTVTVRTHELFDAAHNVLDTHDIEGVHDMRVASRRLRAVLEIYKVCFDKKRHREVLRDVKALADALGERRDPDVQLDALERLRDGMTEAEAPGLELFAGGLRAEQATGNQLLAAMLVEIAESDLKGRLLALGEEAAA